MYDRDSFPLTSKMLFPVTVGGRDGVECAAMQHLGYWKRVCSLSPLV